MRDFSHTIGDDADIYFYLYDGTKMMPVSERFLVKIPKNWSSFYVDLRSNCTIFTDLGESLIKSFALDNFFKNSAKF